MAATERERISTGRAFEQLGVDYLERRALVKPAEAQALRDEIDGPDWQPPERDKQISPTAILPSVVIEYISGTGEVPLSRVVSRAVDFQKTMPEATALIVDSVFGDGFLAEFDAQVASA